MTTASLSKLIPNVGRFDRSIRIVAGLVILVLGLVFQSWWGLLGLVLVGTAMINFCPIYRLFGVNTRK